MRISSLVVSGTFWVVNRQMQQYFISCLSGLDAPLDNGSSKRGLLRAQIALLIFKVEAATKNSASPGHEWNFTCCEKQPSIILLCGILIIPAAAEECVCASSP